MMSTSASIWLSEYINNLYESGLKNDKLVLLHEANINANIAIKTSSWTTEIIPISNAVMQGTVWGGLKCTNTMDDLPKAVMKDEELMYKYRGKVSVPPLEMVDDIIPVAKCGNMSVK